MWVPQNSYALTLNVTIFGEKALKEIIKGGSELIWVDPYFNRTDVLIRRERDTKDTCTQRKKHMRTQQGGGHLKGKEKCLTRNQPLHLLDHGLLSSIMAGKLISVV